MKIVQSSSVQRSPICIINGDSKKYGLYAAEILKAEGLNAFRVETLEAVGEVNLEQYDLVILTEASLTTDQAQVFRTYVSRGGCLIAFRPDKQICDLFGISATDEIFSEGYLRIDGSCVPGTGLRHETLQFHGCADVYSLAGATQIAELYRDAVTPLGFPAVVSHVFGAGRSAAFTYNLPESVVLTRQGNPAFAGQERDGILGIRAAEMYLGWADVTRNALNQADEQMRLLSHLIESFSLTSKPFPRLWYFPGSNRCLVTLTDDGEDSTLEDFEFHFKDIESRGAHMTLYLKDIYIPSEAVSAWTARGHEISSHFDDTVEAVLPTFGGMSAVARASVAAHHAAYGLSPRSVRNHWIVWYGWSEQVEIEAGLGIGLDCNIYHYDRGSTSGHFLGSAGGFTGSGLPMKFADREGRIIDIYQSLTQLPDEQWLEEKLFEEFTALVDRSIDQESYTFINVNFHTDRWQVWSRKPGLDMLDYANARGVPLWTASRTLDFLRAREAVEFQDFRWSGNELRFQFSNPDQAMDLSLLLPKIWNEMSLQWIEKDGVPLDFELFTIKDHRYARFTGGGSGLYTACYG